MGSNMVCAAAWCVLSCMVWSHPFVPSGGLRRAGGAAWVVAVGWGAASSRECPYEEEVGWRRRSSGERTRRSDGEGTVGRVDHCEFESNRWTAAGRPTTRQTNEGTSGVGPDQPSCSSKRTLCHCSVEAGERARAHTAACCSSAPRPFSSTTAHCAVIMTLRRWPTDWMTLRRSARLGLAGAPHATPPPNTAACSLTHMRLCTLTHR